LSGCRRSLIVPGLLAAAFVASVGLNYVLYKQARQYYTEMNTVRLDPLGLRAFEGASPPTTDEPLVVFYGDSRAADWPPPDAGAYAFVNRGVDAQTTAQVLGRFAHDVVPLQPAVVVIQVGINDLKAIPLLPGEKQAIIDHCEENIGRLVEEARDLGATVVLTTIFPAGKVPLERRLFWSDDVGAAVEEVNDYIRSLAADDVVLLDAYSLLADEKGVIKPEYGQDLLHVTPAGYERLNAELAPIITGLY
jgi:lysophospholipase L1-like esterase